MLLMLLILKMMKMMVLLELLVFQDITRDLAASFSSSKNNGNGALSCIPDEWSLLCYTVPYALILLEKDGEEWRNVLEKGGYEIY